MPKQKDEICLGGMGKEFTDWEISRELANSFALNDQSWNARRKKSSEVNGPKQQMLHGE